MKRDANFTSKLFLMTTDPKTENIRKIWDQLSLNLKIFILSRVKSEHDTDDILHETFIRLHENIDKIKNESVKSWLYKVAMNLIADHFRRQQTEIKIRQSAPEVNFRVNASNVMDTAIKDMISMMDNLPPEYCEALCLTEIEGISQKEYAERTGLSYSGAKSRVQRARLMLRDMLLNCCHYEFDHYGTVYGIQPKCCHCC